MTALLLSLLLAAAGGTELERRAVGLYKEGETAYRAGDYDAAIQAFRAADAIAPSPEFDFNIAQAYRKKGDCEKALVSYRNYVRLKPAAIEVKLVREQLAEMEACVKAKLNPEPAPVQPLPPAAAVTVEPAVPAPAPAPVIEPPVEKPAPVVAPPPAAPAVSFSAHPQPESSRRFTVITVALAAGGLALGALGTAFWNSSIGQYNQLAATCGTACDPALTKPSRQQQNLGIGLVTGGAVVLAVAFIFFLVDAL